MLVKVKLVLGEMGERGVVLLAWKEGEADASEGGADPGSRRNTVSLVVWYR